MFYYTVNKCNVTQSKQNHHIIYSDYTKTIGKQTLQLSKRSGDQLVEMIRRTASVAIPQPTDPLVVIALSQKGRKLDRGVSQVCKTSRISFKVLITSEIQHFKVTVTNANLAKIPQISRHWKCTLKKNMLISPSSTSAMLDSACSLEGLCDSSQ